MGLAPAVETEEGQSGPGSVKVSIGSMFPHVPAAVAFLIAREPFEGGPNGALSGI